MQRTQKTRASLKCPCVLYGWCATTNVIITARRARPTVSAQSYLQKEGEDERENDDDRQCQKDNLRGGRAARAAPLRSSRWHASKASLHRRRVDAPALRFSPETGLERQCSRLGHDLSEIRDVGLANCVQRSKLAQEGLAARRADARYCIQL